MARRTTSGWAAAALTALVVALLSPPAAVGTPTWLSPHPLSDAVSFSHGQQVATNEKGDALAVWIQNAPSSTSYVRASFRPAGGSWGPVVDVTEPDTVVFQVRAAMDAAGNATVVWRQNFGGPSIFGFRDRSAGGFWGEADLLTFFGDELEPTIAMDPNGATTVAFREPVPMTTSYRIRTVHRPAGGTWQAPETHSATGAVSSPVIAARAGVVALAWRDATSGTDRIRARVRDPNGTWSAALDLSAAGGAAALPRLAVDASGAVTAAWSRNNGTRNVAQAVSRTPAGVWGAVQDVSDTTKAAFVSRVAVDATGAATLIWSVSEVGSLTVAAASRPAGGSWSAPQTVSGAGSLAQLPDLAVDPAGNAVIAWIGQSSGKPDQFLASRRPAGGTFGPPADLAPPAPASSFNSVQLAADGAGNTVALVSRALSPMQAVIEAVTLDATGPALSGFAVPATGTAGKPLIFSAAATDSWSAVASYTWSFGDGTTASGASVGHTYAKQGAYTVTLTVADAVGNTTARTAAIQVAAPVPAIGMFKLKKKQIATDEKTKLKVELNTKATLKLVFKSKHKHLVKGKQKYLRVVLRKKLPAGLSKITIKAKVSGKILKPDTYVITGTAKNATGTSPKKKVKLKVVR